MLHGLLCLVFCCRYFYLNFSKSGNVFVFENVFVKRRTWSSLASSLLVLLQLVFADLVPDPLQRDVELVLHPVHVLHSMSDFWSLHNISHVEQCLVINHFGSGAQIHFIIPASSSQISQKISFFRIVNKEALPPTSMILSPTASSSSSKRSISAPASAAAGSSPPITLSAIGCWWKSVARHKSLVGQSPPPGNLCTERSLSPSVRHGGLTIAQVSRWRPAKVARWPGC